MLYAIHHGDDHATPGAIWQANKVYVEDLKPYEKQLGELGHTFVKKNAPGLLPPDYWYVKSGEITERPPMHAVAQASTIKAGADAVIVGIPRGASIDIAAAGETIHSIAALDGDELQFTIPVPCRYRVVIRLWPYRDCNIEIEAVK